MHLHFEFFSHQKSFANYTSLQGSMSRVIYDAEIKSVIKNFSSGLVLRG